MTITFQQFLKRLTEFWETRGCILHQGYDLEVGAGTFNPATFLRSLGPEPYRAAYIEPCRRPADGRYGTNPNRLQHYFQFQVILKPSPPDMQELYLQSLEAIGFDLKKHDIRFVHDDWESPTLGAWGLGWEVWMDGMEISQFTYFQAVGGIDLKPVTGEITYGIERLAMYLQKVDSIFDLQWNENLAYGDIYRRNEVEWSTYNFERADTGMWQRHFEDYEREATALITDSLPIPAYDFVMKASHAFNLLDARGVISVTERTGYIGRIRDLARQVAETYLKSRELQGFPLLKNGESKVESTKTSIELSCLSFEENSPETEDFLLEIGSEELPAGFVPIGIRNLEHKIRLLLEKEKIPFETIDVYATPRRLAVYVRGIAKETLPQAIEKKGPSLEQAFDADGSIRPAGEGFFRSLGMDVIPRETIESGKADGMEIREIKGIPYLYGMLRTEGKLTRAILSEQLPALILHLDFPKKMRWADSEIEYARPLRWITALFGSRMIPFRVGDLHSGNLTYGHRSLAPDAILLKRSQDYLEALRSSFVIANVEERKRSISVQLDEIEKSRGFKIVERERVLPQVLHLVEWPFLTFADFRPEFLRLPPEVIVSEMVEHQKYFPVVSGSTGVLENFFIITANVPPTDEIREGNRRVLSARLSDGVFLYEEDLKIPLESFNEKLKKVTFQKDLGTVYEKVRRLSLHSEIVQASLGIGSSEKAKRTAEICKADLASAMVYEFPELQGIIGCYYARAHGEDEEVARAIDEHWMPRAENAPLPETSAGTIVALADKIDNLLGFFAVGLKPTSSSDPYALRRQVLGIIKIVIKGKYRVSLKQLLTVCAKVFSPGIMKNSEETVREILLFISNRLKTVFLDYGFTKEEIEAGMASVCDDLYDQFCRLESLREFRRSSGRQFGCLLEVYKRTKGQVREIGNISVNPELFSDASERKLYSALEKLEPEYEWDLTRKLYGSMFSKLAELQPSVSELYAHVKILDENPDVRKNRLALLARVLALFDRLLDFGKIREEMSSSAILSRENFFSGNSSEIGETQSKGE